MRVRLYRLDDADAFLKQLLTKGEQAALEGGRGGQDPLDTLREAFLWGGRRAFVTVHRTATRALRDVAKQTDRLGTPRLEATAARAKGAALPLEGQPGITFVTELVPKVTEEIIGAKERTEATEEDEIRRRGPPEPGGAAGPAGGRVPAGGAEGGARPPTSRGW